MSDDLGAQGRDDLERRFLKALAAMQPPFCDAWTDRPQLVVSVDVAADSVLRTLRVDFDGRGFVAGNDATHQFTDELDAADPDYLVSPQGLSPEQLAEEAMAWFRMQLRRPIELLEWDDRGGDWKCWVLADTGRRLVAQRADGPYGDAGGSWSSGMPTRPPDRVTKIVLSDD